MLRLGAGNVFESIPSEWMDGAFVDGSEKLLRLVTQLIININSTSELLSFALCVALGLLRIISRSTSHWGKEPFLVHVARSLSANENGNSFAIDIAARELLALNLRWRKST